MAVISYECVLSKIVRLECGIYFLYGDEEYFINSILDILHAKKLNIDAFRGEESDIVEVLKSAYQQSLLGQQNIIVIRNVEKCKYLDQKENQKFLEDFVDNFKANAVVIFVYNNNIVKSNYLLQCFSNSNIFNSKKLNRIQIKSFIKSYCNNRKINISNDDIEKMYDYFGDNVSRIVNELGKNDFKNIVYSREFNAFEFINAIATRNCEKICRIVNNFEVKDQYELIPLLGLIFSFFLRLLVYLDTCNRNNEEFPYLYKSAVKTYSRERIHEIINALEYSDACLKGIKTEIMNYKDILKYITSKIIF